MRFPPRSFGLLLVLAVAACGEAVEPEPQPEPFPPDPAVLHVGWISREPEILPPGPDDPPDAGWPEVGQPVQWIGHVVNSGEVAADSVPYEWTVDGVVVDSGVVSVPPSDTVVILDRTWSGVREHIGLTLHRAPTDADDGSEHAMVVRSDALSLSLYVDTTTVQYMKQHRDILEIQAWVHDEIQAWNRVLDRYRPTEGPAEIEDRIRLDRLEVVPNGWRYPDTVRTDLIWVYYGDIPGPFIRPEQTATVFADQTIVLHELLHQRGLSDLYAYRVRHGTEGAHANGSEVRILEPDSTPAAGGPRMPFVQQGNALVFNTPYVHYLMGVFVDTLTTISPHTAYGMNLRAGRRSPRYFDPFGNPRNAFSSGGPDSYLLHVPDTARIHVTVDDLPVPAGSTVEAFFDHADLAYHNLFLESPDETLLADSAGTVTLDVRRLQTPPPSGAVDTDVIIVRITVGDEWGYGFLPVYELNMEYIRGDRLVGDVAVDVDIR